MIARRSFLTLSASLGATLALGGCNAKKQSALNTMDFRYRLAFTVDVEGEEKTASSIINVHFYGIGTQSPEAGGRRFYSRVQGVAPVMDLGPRHGWLAAALMSKTVEERRRKGFSGISLKPAADAVGIVWAFGDDLMVLRDLKTGKVDLPDTRQPVFVWFPPNASYIKAQQIGPENFASVIGPGVKLRSITAEVASDAPLLKRLEVVAPWLEQLRTDQGDGYPGYNAPWVSNAADGQPLFRVDRQAQIETDRS